MKFNNDYASFLAIGVVFMIIGIAMENMLAFLFVGITFIMLSVVMSSEEQEKIKKNKDKTPDKEEKQEEN